MDPVNEQNRARYDSLGACLSRPSSSPLNTAASMEGVWDEPQPFRYSVSVPMVSHDGYHVTAQAPPPPPPSPPPPPPEETRLTEAESMLLRKVNYNIYNLNPKSERDRSLFRKMDALNPGAYDNIKPKFTQHPDTAFMLGAPRFTLPVPSPTEEYLKCAEDENSTRLSSGQPILLILDLNGTLLFRPDRKKSHVFKRRKDLDAFLRYIFETFNIMIWTTAQPGNAQLMCNSLLRGQQAQSLVDIWDRRSFNLNAHQYNEKTVVYKRLEWIWNSEKIQRRHPEYERGSRWNQSNTILLDDSTTKAKAQPYNHILVPEFAGGESDQHVKAGSVLEQVAGYLEVVRAHSNVSAYMKANPFKVDETGYFKPLRPVRTVKKDAQGKQKELDPAREMFPGMATL